MLTRVYNVVCSIQTQTSTGAQKYSPHTQESSMRLCCDQVHLKIILILGAFICEFQNIDFYL